MLGVAFGAFSYFVQGKGYYYQRYPLIAMTLLWFAVELSIAARRRGVARAIGVAGLAIGIFGLTPLFAERARTIFYSNIFTEDAGGLKCGRSDVARLQHNVQCLDMVDGCMNALYHLHIVQQTGMTGDNLLFPPDANFAVVQKERQRFWDALVAHPPDVFVISDEQFHRSRPRSPSWSAGRSLRSTLRRTMTCAPRTASTSTWHTASTCARAASRTGRGCRVVGAGGLSRLLIHN